MIGLSEVLLAHDIGTNSEACPKPLDSLLLCLLEHLPSSNHSIFLVIRMERVLMKPLTINHKMSLKLFPLITELDDYLDVTRLGAKGFDGLHNVLWLVG